MGKPEQVSVITQNIPDELKEKKRWLVWKWEHRNDKWTKPPYNPATGDPASVTNPSHWSDFETALFAHKYGDWDGIGFVLNGEYSGVDFDGCLDEDGNIMGPAKSEISKLNSYTETSPSQEGLKTLVRAKLPAGGHHKDGTLGVFNTGRYFCITGHRLEEVSPNIEERQSQIDDLVRRYWPGDFQEQKESSHTQQEKRTSIDDILLQKIKDSAQGEKFNKLWSGDSEGYASQSEGDLALCSILAFWTGKDSSQVDRLFRKSGLMRKKWDEKHSGDGRTYGQQTIQKAIQGTSEAYKEAQQHDEKQPKPNEGLSLLRPSTIKNLPPSEPLFEGYPLQRRHLNVLVGAPGDLKTLSTYEYARSVLTGEPLFGKYPCLKRGAVLIIDEDNPGDIVQSRFDRFGFTCDDLPIYLSHMAGFLIDNPAWFRKIEITVHEVNPVLIIIDCFSLVHKQKENQSDEIMRVIKQFRRIANLGPCIVFVHHLTKDKENPSARGSGGIIGAVENEIWNIKKGEATILQFTKKTRQRPLDPIELSVSGFEDESNQAPISIYYRGDEVQILLSRVVEVLRDEQEPIARTSGIDDADTIESRLREKQVSFTDAKLKKALDLGIKSKTLVSGKATLTRANGMPFRTTGYVCSNVR